MTTYPLPNMTESNDLFGMFSYINTVSDGFFISLVLLGIFVILFIETSFKTSTPKALSFASFITFILGLLFSILGLLNQKFVYLSALILALSVFWLLFDND